MTFTPSIKALKPITLEINLDDKKGKSFEQTFVSCQSTENLELIYPMQPFEAENNVRQKVKDYIQAQYDHIKSG